MQGDLSIAEITNAHASVLATKRKEYRNALTVNIYTAEDRIKTIEDFSNNVLQLLNFKLDEQGIASPQQHPHCVNPSERAGGV